ncbi:MAG: peptidylprolyl isomerase [Mangrovibacterium sp.]|nr:peptidylprolyl isomerase [Mangrovibacterium sp.]
MKFARVQTALILALLFSCTGQKQQDQKPADAPTAKLPEQGSGDFTGLIPSIARIESFDGGRFLESENAFFADSNLLVCRLTPVMNATSARITPWDEQKPYPVAGFVAVDRINDLVLMKVDGISRKGIPLFAEAVSPEAKSVYLTKPQGQTLALHRGKVVRYGTVKGSKRYLVTNVFRSQSYGTPVFIAPDKCIGIGYSEIVDYENQNLTIPSNLIAGLISKKQNKPEPLQNLKSSASQATSAANSRIKGLLIETSYGNIRIRLFNQTPEYRDNFIALARENYYDSLLIHRVIKGFGIQSGAADTRYAAKDDVVGWKGPGYTLPAHVVAGLFHKRGMIGSPRKPDRENSKRRSDGSQYYIVTGRTYTDTELNELEKENNHRFTPEQRQVYKTAGGAPHLDGTYTIFGEVTEGLDVADKISQVETDSEFRPLKDIRVKKVTILK